MTIQHTTRIHSQSVTGEISLILILQCLAPTSQPTNLPNRWTSVQEHVGFVILLVGHIPVISRCLRYVLPAKTSTFSLFFMTCLHFRQTHAGCINFGSFHPKKSENDSWLGKNIPSPPESHKSSITFSTKTQKVNTHLRRKKKLHGRIGKSWQQHVQMNPEHVCCHVILHFLCFRRPHFRRLLIPLYTHSKHVWWSGTTHRRKNSAKSLPMKRLRRVAK